MMRKLKWIWDWRVEITIGGPYVKDERRPLIQQATNEGFIVWNWDTADWDRVLTRVRIAGQAVGEPNDN
jgi:hypothetical protein